MDNSDSEVLTKDYLTNSDYQKIVMHALVASDCLVTHRYTDGIWLLTEHYSWMPLTRAFMYHSGTKQSLS